MEFGILLEIFFKTFLQKIIRIFLSPETIIFLERNVLIKEALMMVLVQVAMEFAAHVSF